METSNTEEKEKANKEVQQHIQEVNDNTNEDNVGAMVIYEANNEEVLPLAVQINNQEDIVEASEVTQRVQEESMDPKGANVDKGSLEANINKAAI